MTRVTVIGAGASGMMAALTAAEDKDNRVVLLERQQRPGRKLLSTGNGRCNLTNTGARSEKYHGEQPGFWEPALAAFTPEDTERFFSGLGLVMTEEYGGRVYPLSNSANSVLDVLRFALDKAGVEVRCSQCVREIKKSGDGFTVMTDSGSFDSDKLIVACGGAAGAKLGGVMDGYELLKPLGHKRTAIYPALVQLICDSEYPRSLKGVRADGRLSLTVGGEVVAEGFGEIQFTDNGVSGPAAFDISRAASVGGKGLTVCADFLRNMTGDEVTEMLRVRRRELPFLEAGELFTGMLHNRLGRMTVKYAGINGAAALGSLSDEELAGAAAAAKGFSMKLKGTEGFDCAQVTAGGIKTGGFNPETLESWFVPGLFVCGELLDVDADCGGYNLQWAWASGRLAGRLGR